MSHNEKLKRMIDDYKIIEASKVYNEIVEKELSKRLTRKTTSAERYADTTSRQCDFVAGAKWMQEEFLKELWHDASEEPKENLILALLLRLIKNLVKVVSLIARSFAKYGSYTLVASESAQTTRM